MTKGSSTWNYSFDQNTLGETSVEDPNGNVTVSNYDTSGNPVSQTNALGNTSTYSYNSFSEQTCAAAPLAANPCSSLTPPSAVSPGGTITPPTSAPPKYVTYTLYDTNGNEIYQTTGDYAPGSGTASQSRTTYHLYNGNSVTLGGTSDSCTTSAPSTELPCATIDPNGVVTQLTYDSAGDLASKSTPDGNSGGEKAKTSYSYDADGEQTSMVASDGNLSGANAGNYTTTSAYDADGEKTSVIIGGGSGHTVVPRTTTYTYDADGNRTATTHSASPQADRDGLGSRIDLRARRCRFRPVPERATRWSSRPRRHLLVVPLPPTTPTTSTPWPGRAPRGRAGIRPRPPAPSWTLPKVWSSTPPATSTSRTPARIGSRRSRPAIAPSGVSR